MKPNVRNPIDKAISILLGVLGKPLTYDLDEGQILLIEQAIDKLEQVETEQVGGEEDEETADAS